MAKLGELEIADVVSILRTAAKKRPYNATYIILYDVAEALEEFASAKFNGRNIKNG